MTPVRDPAEGQSDVPAAPARRERFSSGALSEVEIVNSVVLIKQVPDTATQIHTRVKDGRVDLEGVTWVVGPYDEYAVEEAIRSREAHGGTVTLVTLGPERADDALKSMLALGADEAVRVWDDAFGSLGPRATAAVLAAVVRKLPHDVVWTGWKSVDADAGLVPIYLAAALGLPHVSFVVGVERADAGLRLRREIEGGKEIVETSVPAVLSAQKGLNEVRYATLKGIMAVKSKSIPVWGPADIGLSPSDLPAAGIETIAIEAPAERGTGRIITGTPTEAAQELVRVLHTEAKVI